MEKNNCQFNYDKNVKKTMKKYHILTKMSDSRFHVAGSAPLAYRLRISFEGLPINMRQRI
jgi:hypothetical protein